MHCIQPVTDLRSSPEGDRICQKTDLPETGSRIDDEGMRWRTVLILLIIASATALWASVVDEVRIALAQNNFSAADSYLASYRAQAGITPEYVEAYSWMARAALDAGQYDQATAYAKQTEDLALAQLKQHPLDSEPHLPIALGAALEVRAQVLAAQGERTQASRCLAHRVENLRQHVPPGPLAEEPEPAVAGGTSRAARCAASNFSERNRHRSLS